MLTNVVGSTAPLHKTEDPLTKLVPVKVSVNADPPAVAELGTSWFKVGFPGAIPEVHVV